jgi:hypothetical protein
MQRNAANEPYWLKLILINYFLRQIDSVQLVGLCASVPLWLHFFFLKYVFVPAPAQR